ncbi:hypothetical protein RvY_18087-2 [Ramazzottius varieornatus]|uniref:DUF7042 domain-containing protein n=1 Tax=Ramazzottius varieornatus TaxID=947166 RepID=A0A1D1W4H3_RAMVA|nr:hypothetical protein RvY_18087-2 [Ramazzottius varieornatus]
MVRHLSTVIFLLVFRSFRCGRDSRRPFEGNLPQNCTVPAYIQNKYYSRENGQNMFTTIQSNSFTRLRKVSIPGSIVETSVQRDTQVQETCLLMQCNRPNKVTGRCQSFQQTSDISGGIVYDSDRYRFLIHDTSTKCYRCREIAVRTINVLELRETECLTFGGNVVPDMTYLCGKLKGTKMDGNVERASWTTLFSQKPTRVSCRSSIEGSWTFKYSIQRYSQHKCLHPKNNLTSCPDPANRYSTEDRFYISYGACDDYAWKKGDPGLSFLRDMAMTFVCLGDWYIGNDHFFAAVNLGENRPEEQYRCFMENHDDDQYIGHSLAATCSTLLAPRVSPVMLHLFRAKTTTIAPSCSLPANFSGRWMNTAHAAVNSWIDINATHLLEKHRPDQRVNEWLKQTFEFI